LRIVSGKAQVDAKIRIAFATKFALLARDRGIDSKARTVRSDTGKLVTENERRVQPRIANRALVEPVQIGTAQPDCRHADQCFVLSGNGHRLIVKTQITHAM
jgi:hypothetical protein